MNHRKIWSTVPPVFTPTPTPPPTPTPTAPGKLTNPTISSPTLTVGDIATTVHGTYSGTVIGYSGQWYSGGMPINLAVGLTYNFGNADIGLNITYEEFAFNSVGASAVGISNSLGPIISAVVLAAPSLDYPSPIASNPASIALHIPADWQSGDVGKLARSASPAMTSPSILSHTITDADIIAGTVSIGLSGIALAGVTYFQAYGNHGGADSTNKSNIAAWGDTVVPTITTSAAQANTETQQLAIALTATDTGGVPALLSDGVSPGWRIDSGPDQAEVQVTIVGGVPTVQWINNGTMSAATKLDQTLNNTYNFTVAAIDYSGNKSTLAITVTVSAADLTPNAFSWTNQTGVTRSSTIIAIDTWTVAGLGTGVNAPLSATANIRVSTDSGLTWTAWGSPPLTVKNGDQIQAEVSSSASYETPVSNAVTVGTLTATFTATTLADPANVVWTPETAPAGQNIAFGANTATFAGVNFGVGMGIVFTASSDRQITGVTVGGVSATLVSECGATTRHVAMWRVNIASGGAKSVVLTGAGGFNLKYVAIASGTMTPSSQTPSSTATPLAYGYRPDPQALASITVPTNGIALCAATSESPDSPASWNTGLMEADVIEDTTANGGLVLTTAHLRTTGAFSLNGFNNAGCGMVAAAWAP